MLEALERGARLGFVFLTPPRLDKLFAISS